ncbi:hypothetical protein DQ04_19481010 [Trypanosoma grayi]|uniref:hypothetical protein n=1 Tax=Trypanosoma grayi TaxID=71804 RepID=UPI0004F480B4|nr:hypothetical protein DQ04_19481010 [Trypanosoma grayi]KEG05671.1 hypothetical protein DQ04_19481010 [Trypanosoma grayi]
MKPNGGGSLLTSPAAWNAKLTGCSLSLRTSTSTARRVPAYVLAKRSACSSSPVRGSSSVPLLSITSTATATLRCVSSPATSTCSFRRCGPTSRRSSSTYTSEAPSGGTTHDDGLTFTPVASRAGVMLTRTSRRPRLVKRSSFDRPCRLRSTRPKSTNSGNSRSGQHFATSGTVMDSLSVKTTKLS